MQHEAFKAGHESSAYDVPGVIEDGPPLVDEILVHQGELGTHHFEVAEVLSGWAMHMSSPDANPSGPSESNGLRSAI
jgi:hypothetical protein